MKVLKKFQLINWHVFTNEIVSVKNNILITGENGSGKSTVIDAFYYLLSGGDAKNFNSAADLNNKRTVESYMRGKTGEESKEFIRTQANLLSYIALEFLETEDNTSFVFGVALEIRNNAEKASRTFFNLGKTKLSPGLFFDKDKDNLLLNFNMLNKKYKDKFDSREYGYFSDSIVANQRRIKDIFNIIDNKYFDLLKKAMAFKPIIDIRDFVFKFLLPEENVNLNAIQKNLTSYRDLKNELLTEENKLAALTPINNKGLEYKRLEKEVQLLNKLYVDLEIKKIKNAIIDSEIKISKLNKENLDIAEKVRNIEIDKEKYKEEKYLLNSNTIKIQYDHILENLIKQNDDLKELNVKKEKYSAEISSEEEIASAFNLSLGLNNFISDFPAFIQKAKDYKIKLKEKRAELDEKNSIINISLQTKNDTLTNLEDRREKLENGLFSYPKEVSALVSILNEKFPNAKVTPFCEYLDIKNTIVSRDLLEGVLDNHRFDLFIDSEYYEEAVKFCEKYEDKEKIENVALVELAALKDIAVNKDSIYHFYKVEDSYANLYLKNLVKDICITDEFIIDNKDQITQEKLLYTGSKAKLISQKIIPYLGKDSIKLQLQEVSRQIDDLNKEIKVLENNYDENEKLLGLDTKSGSIIHHDDVYTKINELIVTIKKLEEDKVNLEKSNDLFSIEERIAQLEQLIKDLVEKEKEFGLKKEEVLKKIGTEETLSKYLQEKLNNEDLQFELPSHLFGEYESFKAEGKYKTSEDVKIKWDREIDTLNKSRKDIEKLMDSYISQYRADTSSDISSLEDFFEYYKKSSAIDAVKYKEDCDKALALAEKIFQAEYLTKIKENMDIQKSNIYKLNKHLEGRKFGIDEETFFFEIRKSSDKEFGAYYDIIDSGVKWNSDNLFIESLSGKDKDTMEKLFDKLANVDNNEKAKKEIDRIIDYRNYMDYDIKITNKHGGTTYFSKINKEKSGGEVQSPFYILMAGCFERVSRNSSAKGFNNCIVLLDEAFNNMDNNRIETMMEYFNNLNIQFVIITPPTRAVVIAPYVDTYIGAHKDNNRGLLLRIEHE